jgi:uncharacterized protein YoxC
VDLSPGDFTPEIQAVEDPALITTAQAIAEFGTEIIPVVVVEPLEASQPIIIDLSSIDSVNEVNLSLGTTVEEEAKPEVATTEKLIIVEEVEPVFTTAKSSAAVVNTFGPFIVDLTSNDPDEEFKSSEIEEIKPTIAEEVEAIIEESEPVTVIDDLPLEAQPSPLDDLPPEAQPSPLDDLPAEALSDAKDAEPIISITTAKSVDELVRITTELAEVVTSAVEENKPAATEQLNEELVPAVTEKVELVETTVAAVNEVFSSLPEAETTLAPLAAPVEIAEIADITEKIETVQPTRKFIFKLEENDAITREEDAEVITDILDEVNEISDDVEVIDLVLPQDTIVSEGPGTEVFLLDRDAGIFPTEQPTRKFIFTEVQPSPVADLQPSPLADLPVEAQPSPLADLPAEAQPSPLDDLPAEALGSDTTDDVAFLEAAKSGEPNELVPRDARNQYYQHQYTDQYANWYYYRHGF